MSTDDQRVCINAAISGGGTPITALVTREDDGWSVSLSPGSHGRQASKRLGLAVRRVCELDAAVGMALRSGRTVTRFVPLRPSRNDGPHTAVEQVIPLLLPRRINDELYTYQRQGVAWLLRRSRALLADDMGLGKTAQALSGARRLLRWGEISWVLVVAPRTLVANWVAETYRWAPELTVATALPLGADRAVRWSRLARRAHILVTSYEQLREPPKVLYKNVPSLIIADEAHRLRKAGTLSTEGIRTLRLERFWALTGTPVEKNAQDLATLFSLLHPSWFSSDDKSLHVASLRARVRPYFLRRRKSSVLKELPPVIEAHETLELTSQQSAAYRRAIVNHRLSKAGGNFLALFNRLRMLCDVDPASGASSKLDRTVELIDDIAKAGEKAVVFSYLIEPLRWLEKRLGAYDPSLQYVVLTGEMALDERNTALEMFRSRQECSALLASTRVASEGLTLTEASHVIFINRWWNPSSNTQARDRVVRIGQRRTVRIVFFTCQGTVEDRLDTLLKRKTLTFDQLIEVLSKPSNETKRLATGPSSLLSVN